MPSIGRLSSTHTTEVQPRPGVEPRPEPETVTEKKRRGKKKVDTES